MADGPTVAASRRVLALGATSAIAEATFRLLAEQHATLFLVGRNAQRLAAVRNDLLTRGATAATTFTADLDEHCRPSGHAGACGDGAGRD